MKLSRLIPAIAAVGGAVAFAVYKLQKNKKENFIILRDLQKQITLYIFQKSYNMNIYFTYK